MKSEDETMPELVSAHGFIRHEWEWDGETYYVLFAEDIGQEKIDGIIRLAKVEASIDKWHLDYTGPLSLEEYAGFTMDEYTEYLRSDGENIGEISDARIERIIQNRLSAP